MVTTTEAVDDDDPSEREGDGEGVTRRWVAPPVACSTVLIAAYLPIRHPRSDDEERAEGRRKD